LLVWVIFDDQEILIVVADSPGTRIRFMLEYVASIFQNEIAESKGLDMNDKRVDKRVSCKSQRVNARVRDNAVNVNRQDESWIRMETERASSAFNNYRAWRRASVHAGELSAGEIYMSTEMKSENECPRSSARRDTDLAKGRAMKDAEAGFEHRRWRRPVIKSRGHKLPRNFPRET